MFGDTGADTLIGVAGAKDIVFPLGIGLYACGTRTDRPMPVRVAAFERARTDSACFRLQCARA
jgi:hypothetical protein